jgi:NOL1/NOP2/fmu family ribosome biogenesis protein
VLTKHSEFEVCRTPSALEAVTASGIPFEGATHPEALLLTRRFYPQLFSGEGQFICLMRKKNTDELPKMHYRDAAKPLGRTEMRLLEEFLRTVLKSADAEELLRSSFGIYKDTIFLRNDQLPLPPFGVYMPGVTVGTLIKGRIEPHHQFFSAFGKSFLRTLSLPFDSPEVEKYLRGESFAAELPNGYAAVLVNGAPLGGVKVVDGIAKNHYPKGLRLH